MPEDFSLDWSSNCALILIFLMVPVSFIGFDVAQAQPLRSSNQHDTIRVGVDRNAAPMEYESDGEPKGFNVDVIDLVGTEMGVTLEYVFLSWPDVLDSVKNGSLDVMFAVDTPERREDYGFSRPILNISWRIFVQEETFGVSGIEDLRNHTVAVVENFASHDYLLEHNEEIHAMTVANTLDALELLSRGEVFAFFGQYHLARYYIQEGPITNIKAIGEDVWTNNFCISVKKDNPVLLTDINTALEHIFISGQYDEIYEKWYGTKALGPSGWANFPATIATGVFVILGVFLAGFIVSLLWAYSLRLSVDKRTRELRISEEQLLKVREEEERYHLMLSHFVKNDLQSIISSLQLYEAKNSGLINDFDHQTLLEVIKRCFHSSKTIDIVNRIFMIVGTKQDPNTSTSVMVGLQIQQAVENVQKRAGYSIATQIDKDLNQLTMKNGGLLTEAFEELLGFITDQSHEVIVVQGSSNSSYYNISVEGKGFKPIPKEITDVLAEKINDEWVSQGHFIGLTLVSVVMSYYQGRLTIKPSEPDGNIFVLSFPLSLIETNSKDQRL